MARENEIVAIFQNETPSGKKLLKGKTIKDVPAGTRVVLWPVDRTENQKRPMFRLEVDTYVPKKDAEEKALDEAVAAQAEDIDDTIPF